MKAFANALAAVTVPPARRASPHPEHRRFPSYSTDALADASLDGPWSQDF